MPISFELAQKLATVPPPRTIRKIEAVESAAQYKAAVYCCVSTDHEDQEGSIEVQRDHFLSAIGNASDMSFVDIYFEQGVSGTKKETRPELQRLLSDCRLGRVNLVLTKSISRFARNTTDCLEMVRNLTAMGVSLVFEKENIDTRTMDSEFLLTILASLAENESRSFSDNNRWAIQKRFKDNTYRPARAPFGYDLVDGCYVVNKTEAAVVRTIFDQYLSGIGPGEIAATLNRGKVPMKRVNEKWKKTVKHKWNCSVINSILHNIAYVGDALFQKSFKDHEFKTRTNKGEYPQYLIQNRHEPIISRDVFLRAQNLIEKHRDQHNTRKGKAGERHFLTGRLFCGCCGAPMKRLFRRKGCSYNHTSWGCIRHVQEQSCPAQSVLDDGILNGLATMMNKLRFMIAALPAYADAAEREWKEAHFSEIAPLEERLRSIRADRDRLAVLWTQRGIEAHEYYREKNELETNERLVQRELTRIVCPAKEKAMRLYSSLRDGTISVEDFVARHVERITFPDRFHAVFELKCGLCLRENVMYDIEA